MKKLFALIALVAFFGAIASPAIAANFSAPIAINVPDEKPKKAEASTEKQKKVEGSAEKKAGCETKKECGGSEKK